MKGSSTPTDLQRTAPAVKAHHTTFSRVRTTRGSMRFS